MFLRPGLFVLTYLGLIEIVFGTVTYTYCDQNACLLAFSSTTKTASSFCQTYLRHSATVLVTPTVTVSGTKTISPVVTKYPTIPAKATPHAISTKCSSYFKSVSLVGVSLFESQLSSACHCVETDFAITPVTVTTTINMPPTTTYLSQSCTNLANPYTPSVAPARKFNLACGKYYTSYYDFTLLTNLSTFKQCIDACAKDTTCVGLSWHDSTSTGDGTFCSLFPGLDGTGPYDGGDGAVLIGYVP